MGRVSVWEDDQGLEMEAGDGCTAIGMYLTLLNCTLRTG